MGIAVDHGDKALRRDCEALGEGLRTSIDGVLQELAERGVHDQRSIQETFGLSQSATSRLLSAVRNGDALATLSFIPGPEALNQMVLGAAKAGVSKVSLTRVRDVISSMSSFLNSRVGGRTALDAVLSDWVPEFRPSFELRHKASAYKAMSAIRGVQADLILTCGIVYPSNDPGMHDAVAIEVMLGCRRVRASGVLSLSNSQVPPDPKNFRLQTLGGNAIRSWSDLVLHDYSTIPSECISVKSHGAALEITVRDLPLGGSGMRGADLVSAHVMRGMHRAKRGTTSRTAGLAGQAEPPAEYFVLDLLLHDDVWPNISPELSIYDTVVRGNAHPDDPARDGDRLHMAEVIQSLGRGPDCFRLAQYSRYGQVVRDTCDKLGWDASKLRGYRVKIRYPIHGSQVGLAFALPN